MTVMMIERAEVYVDDQNGNEKQTSDEKVCPLMTNDDESINRPPPPSSSMFNDNLFVYFQQKSMNEWMKDVLIHFELIAAFIHSFTQ